MIFLNFKKHGNFIYFLFLYPFLSRLLLQLPKTNICFNIYIIILHINYIYFNIQNLFTWAVYKKSSKILN